MRDVRDKIAGGTEKTPRTRIFLKEISITSQNDHFRDLSSQWSTFWRSSCFWYWEFTEDFSLLQGLWYQAYLAPKLPSVPTRHNCSGRDTKHSVLKKSTIFRLLCTSLDVPGNYINAPEDSRYWCPLDMHHQSIQHPQYWGHLKKHRLRYRCWSLQCPIQSQLTYIRYHRNSDKLESPLLASTDHSQFRDLGHQDYYLSLVPPCTHYLTPPLDYVEETGKWANKKYYKSTDQ